MSPRESTAVRRALAAAAVLVATAAACTPPAPPAPGSEPTASSPTSSPSATVTPTGDDPATPSSPGTAAPTEPAPSSSGSGTATPPAPESSPTAPGAQPLPSATAEQTEPAPGGGSAVPTVVHAGRGADGRVTVNGFVAGVVEDGGTCTAVLSGGGATSRASAPAFADASATWCDPLVLDPVDGDVGGWSVVLTYSSPSHEGTSEKAPVTSS